MREPEESISNTYELLRKKKERTKKKKGEKDVPGSL
jgi:hypothetical protein